MDRMMKNMFNGRGSLFSQQSVVVQTQSTSDDMKAIQQILAAQYSSDAKFNVNEQVHLMNMAQDILNKANPTFPPLVSLGRGKAPLLDIIVYAGYTFMGISLAILAGNFSSYPYYIVLTGLCICMGFFLVKTMKRVLSAEDEKIDPKVHLEEMITDELVLNIHKIGCELSCNCSGGGDLTLITVTVFDTLVKYSWEEKLVMALLAFAVNYGDYCLPRQVDATNPLAKYLVQFKSLPDIRGQKALINNLMKVVIDTAKSIIELKELHSQYPQYISQDKPPLSLAKISDDVYWAIKGIVACSSQSTVLMNVGNQNWGKITDAACITDLIHKLENRHRNLTDILDRCNKVIDKKKIDEAYYILKEFMKGPHTIVEVLNKLIPTEAALFHRDTNEKVLNKLIHTEGNTLLFQRDTNTKVSLDVLQSKMVILFFSYFDISVEEIREIEQQIWKTDQRRYEIVWLPVLCKQEISDETKEVIVQKARLMPWYSLHDSMPLQPWVIKYIEKHWKFEKNPLLVAFNEQGNVNSCTVYDKIMLWGSKACPFDAQAEENLWETFKWELEIFIDKKWVKEGKLIYLYGGDDLHEIKKFISTMKTVVNEDMIKLIYVGKKHKETIGNLTECWDDQMIMRFWARMYSIFNYKVKSFASNDNDKTFKDVMTLLGSVGSRYGWAIVGHGSDNMVALNGEKIQHLLAHLDKLPKVPITIQEFFIELDKIKTPPVTHCSHIYIPGTSGIVKGNMRCPICSCPMEKKVMFECCKNV